MKKIISIITLITILFTLCSCGKKEESQKPVEKVITLEEVYEIVNDEIDGYYNYILKNDGVSITPDGSSIHIDSMDDYYTEDFAEIITLINKHLGFNDSVIDKMSMTRAIDGMQTEENKNFKLTWSYHGDDGFNVIYESKN